VRRGVLPDFLFAGRGREKFSGKVLGIFSGTIVEKIPGGFFLQEKFEIFLFAVFLIHDC